MTTLEYLKQAPKGTSSAQMAKIVQTYNGDKTKIEKAIKELWEKFEDSNSWVEVAPKQKKKVVKPVTSTYRGKKQFNGQQNGTKKNGGWVPRTNNTKVSKESASNTEKVDKSAPPKNSWASKLFKPEPEEVKPPPKLPVTKTKPVKQKPPPAPLVKKEKPKEEKKEPVAVQQLEAELFKATPKEVKEVKQKPIVVKKEVVKAGVIWNKNMKKKGERLEVSGLGKVSFGSSKTIAIDLTSLATDAGKELVPYGTLAKMKELERELQRARDEVKHLKNLQIEVQSEISQAADKNRSYSRRIQELESAAQEKDNLRDEVSKLTKQLEDHQVHQRQYYDRMKDDSHTEDEATKPPTQPPGPVPPQQGYNMPPPQQVYQGMPYFHQPYYSNFAQYPPSPGPGPPPSRYNYETQGSHPPPNHPPGPTPAPPGEHGHFAPPHQHEEYRGSGMRRGMPPQAPSRDMGMEKNPQHPPPGYGNQQPPYGYPPNVNMMYQQQQQQQQPPSFPSQGQQKWNSGR